MPRVSAQEPRAAAVVTVRDPARPQTSAPDPPAEPTAPSRGPVLTALAAALVLAAACVAASSERADDLADRDAGRALAVGAAAHADGDAIVVNLTARNRSGYAVRLTTASVEGLRTRLSLPAPVEVPAGGTRRVSLVLELAECLGRGQAFVGASAGEAADVELGLQGRAGDADLTVQVPGLTQLRTELLRRHCQYVQ